MPEGDKSSYTDKQKRKAEHIIEGYESRGVPEEDAERIAWATVNKQDGGGKKSGSGRKKSGTKQAAQKPTKKTSTKKAGSKTTGSNKTGAKKKTSQRKTSK